MSQSSLVDTSMFAPCGGVISLHDAECSHCHLKEQEIDTNLYVNSQSKGQEQ